MTVDELNKIINGPLAVRLNYIKGCLAVDLHDWARDFCIRTISEAMEKAWAEESNLKAQIPNS